VSEVIDQWHPDVVADFRELPQDVQAAYLEPIEVIKPDPKLGEHLDRRASTGELSVHRKVRFGAKPLGSCIRHRPIDIWCTRHGSGAARMPALLVSSCLP